MTNVKILDFIFWSNTLATCWTSAGSFHKHFNILYPSQTYSFVSTGVLRTKNVGVFFFANMSVNFWRLPSVQEQQTKCTKSIFCVCVWFVTASRNALSSRPYALLLLNNCRENLNQRAYFNVSQTFLLNWFELSWSDMIWKHRLEDRSIYYYLWLPWSQLSNDLALWIL